MKKYVELVKTNINLYKKYYLFIFFLFMMGIIFGSMLITIIKPEEQNLAVSYFDNFINSVKHNTCNISFRVFMNSLITNLSYVIIIWLMGISIIGVPIIVILIFFKGFVVGFSIGLVVFKYKLIGLFGAILYVLPHNLISVAAIILVSLYAIIFSINLSLSAFRKKTISFRNTMGRYSRIGIFSVFLMIVATIIEVFLMPVLIKLFLLVI